MANRYKLRADVRSVNLSGMGCSGALIAVGLARNILRVAPPGSHVLIVATEILSSMLYTGTKREMLVPNVLFRMGAAAMIMANSPDRARFWLGPIVRTLTAAKDSDYRCAFQEEDEQGITGINLSKDLPVVAANALKGHITAFGPAVLPVSSGSRSPSSDTGSSVQVQRKRAVVVAATARRLARCSSTSASTRAAAGCCTRCSGG